MPAVWPRFLWPRPGYGESPDRPAADIRKPIPAWLAARGGT